MIIKYYLQVFHASNSNYFLLVIVFFSNFFNAQSKPIVADVSF
jgi:hypothetical protein